MEQLPSLFDICVVCALPEELKAVLQVMPSLTQNPIQEGVSPQYGYDFRFTTLKNTEDEPLSLHLSWLPRYGPQEMVLHLSHVLEEYRPRMVIMTGICAGDRSRVQLGDLVVAERTFSYDTGKFSLDAQGQPVHLHDTMTFQLDATILQFLPFFMVWEPLLAQLKRPALPKGKRLARRTVACHLKPMASSSAVHADDPFEAIREPVRGTIAIDMEGAAFASVAARAPWTRWLVVKGVCDYADQEKNDAYHDYAARASALYALCFIQSYVTTKRLPRLQGSSNRDGPLPLWHVPFPRNPYFLGREEQLNSLREQLVPGVHTTALTQSISGLGGIGKTQVAIEYAHRYGEHYTAVFWIQADSLEVATASWLQLATQVLGLPEQQEAEQQIVEVKRWLQKRHGWLLILDNVESPQETLSRFIPSKHQGNVLITTRRRDVGTSAHSEMLSLLSGEDAVLFLLRRARCIPMNASVTEATADDLFLARDLCQLLDRLPLALDQAGAYIAENGCSLQQYTDLYHKFRPILLDRRNADDQLGRRNGSDHPDSLLMTFWLSWDQIQQHNMFAGKALQFCAFLAPNQIPVPLVQTGVLLSENEGRVNDLEMDEALGLLHRYSLIERTEHLLSLHQLVQEVIQEVLSEEERQQWMKKAVLAVDAIFPSGEHGTWPLCEFLLPHALICAKWIKDLRQRKSEGVRLLNAAGLYLYERAQYRDAEPLYKQALAISEEQLGIFHPVTAAILNNLASLYENQGCYGDAEPLYKRVLSIREEQLGPSSSETAASLNNLASLYEKYDRYKDAEPLYLQALTITEEQLGPFHPQTATSLNNLALLYVNQGRYGDAEPLYKRSLFILEEQLGTSHPNTSTTLNNLAELYRTQSRYRDAEPLYKRALAITEEQLGPSHPDTAITLNNLALFYENQGLYRDAEPLYKRALTITEEQLGLSHPDTTNTLDNLASLYKAMGRFEDAEPLYKRAVMLSRAFLGIEHPHSQRLLRSYLMFLLDMYPDGYSDVLFQLLEQKEQDQHMSGGSL